MIQANELRIGNWVIKNGEIFNIVSIYLSCFTSRYLLQLTNGNHEKHETEIRSIIDKCDYVPITEELLLKFGFIEIHKSEFVWKFELEKHPSIEIILLPSIGFYVKGQLLAFIKYVHQIQNLYFALTQTELEYSVGKPLILYKDGKAVNNPTMVSLELKNTKI